MKKIILTSIILTSLLALTGCNDDPRGLTSFKNEELGIICLGDYESCQQSFSDISKLENELKNNTYEDNKNSEAEKNSLILPSESNTHKAKDSEIKKFLDKQSYQRIDSNFLIDLIYGSDRLVFTKNGNICAINK